MINKKATSKIVFCIAIALILSVSLISVAYAAQNSNDGFSLWEWIKGLFGKGKITGNPTQECANYCPNYPCGYGDPYCESICCELSCSGCGGYPCFSHINEACESQCCFLCSACPGYPCGSHQSEYCEQACNCGGGGGCQAQGCQGYQCGGGNPSCEQACNCPPQCTDNDGDGYGNPGAASCSNGAAKDCDDANFAIYPGAPELCNYVDDDCDIAIDEHFPDLHKPCTAGGVGECDRTGFYVCKASGTGVVCDAVPGQPANEICDGKDNDCDGKTDNIPGTSNPLQRGCYEGPPGTESVGECKGGTQTCMNAKWSGLLNGVWTEFYCQDEVTPKEEECDDKDNDCDGAIDEDFLGLHESCTAGVGECKRTGFFVCNAYGTGIVCDAVPGQPANEICDGKDNDCDGVIDNNPNNPIQNSLTEVCGKFDPNGLWDCTGMRECSFWTQTWTDCHDSLGYPVAGKDAGICAKCDKDGNRVYDDKQVGDCAPTMCPQDGCGILGNCPQHVWADYPISVPNSCEAIDKCSAINCQANCEADNDSDGWSGTCGDCNDNPDWDPSAWNCPNNPNLCPHNLDDCFGDISKCAICINPDATECCDEKDNDCDKQLDDGIPNKVTDFGGDNQGECQTQIESCQNGIWDTIQWPIVPRSELPSVPAEACNGLDDDCDLQVDEHYVSTPIGCGMGVCNRTGFLICDNGLEKNTCVPGNPGTEVCDGVDNNCDGNIDEGYVPTPTTCGVGVCVASGELICSNGNETNTCTPGEPTSDANCNGIDDDCDGIVDDNYVETSTTCGEGLCLNDTGKLICVSGTPQEACTPLPQVTVYYDGDNDAYGNAANTQEVCTIPGGYLLTDDDCNDADATISPGADDICDVNKNVIDKDCDATNNGELDCNDFCGDIDGDGYVTAEKYGEWGGVIPSIICPWIVDQGDCNDADAAVHPGANDINCNGVDDNCNGAIDEGYVPTPTSCGVGACARTGQLVCISGTLNNTCIPGTSTTETCNGIDDNCNGVADDLDADSDGMNDCNGADKCPGSVADNIALNPNQYGQNSFATSAFESGPSNDQSIVYNMQNTKGCTYKQIVAKSGVGIVSNKGDAPGILQQWTGIDQSPDRVAGIGKK